jgi:Iron-containing alcohol dehydrogenase
VESGFGSNRPTGAVRVGEFMGILISDFDDTITRYDFFDLVRKRWPFPAQDDPWEKFVAGEITHFEALAEIFASIRTTEADLLELADSTELAPSFAKSVRVLQDHGWEVVIASKYIAFLSRLPYLSVPTSLSNDGFCSPSPASPSLSAAIPCHRLCHSGSFSTRLSAWTPRKLSGIPGSVTSSQNSPP